MVDGEVIEEVVVGPGSELEISPFILRFDFSESDAFTSGSEEGRPETAAGDDSELQFSPTSDPEELSSGFDDQSATGLWAAPSIDEKSEGGFGQDGKCGSDSGDSQFCDHDGQTEDQDGSKLDYGLIAEQDDQPTDQGDFGSDTGIYGPMLAEGEEAAGQFENGDGGREVGSGESDVEELTPDDEDLGERTVIMEVEEDDLRQQGTMIIQAPIKDRAKLILREGAAEQTEFDLSLGDYIIGRSDECDVMLDEPSVSRRHAQLLVDLDGVTIKDLQSTAGVLVSNQKIDEIKLVEGDIIQLGTAVMELVEASGPIDSSVDQSANRFGSDLHNQAPSKTGRSAIKIASAAGIGMVLAAAVVFGIMSMGSDKKPLVQQREQQVQATKPKVDPQALLEQRQKSQISTHNLIKGKEALVEKDYETAQIFFRKAVVINPENKEAQTELDKVTKIIARQKAETERIEKERQARLKKIGDLQAKADAALKAKSYPEAIAVAQDVLKLEPGSTEAQEVITKAKAAQTEARKAANRQKRIIQDHVNRVKSAYNNAVALDKKGRLAEAVRAWNKVMELDKNKATPYYEKSKIEINRALAQIKAQSNKHMAEGKRLETAGDDVRAVKEYYAAVKVDPWNKKAAQALAAVKERLSGLAKKNYQEGEVYESLGQMTKACAKWKKALQYVTPGDAYYDKIRAKKEKCGQ